MNRARLWSFTLLPLLGPLSGRCLAQDSKPGPAKGESTLSVQANLVLVPAVVSDKHGLVTSLTKDNFSLSVDGKVQPIRYFDRETDVPLTVGLLVDVSRSQESVLEEEQKASQTFLESVLAPATAGRPADKAFVLQFARTAELLQDVTDSRPLLAAGLKEIGTQAPGSTDDNATQDSNGNNGNGGNGNGSGGGNGSGNGGNNGGYGRGGRSGGGNGGSGNGDRSNRGSGGTVMYDALYLSSNDVTARQKGRRALILLTDGVDRHSKESVTEAIESLQRADTVVYAIYYKGEEHHDFYPGGRRGYDGGGGYPGGRGGYPGSGGSPGSDGTYAPVDGKKILERICGETGGRMFEVKGKGSVEAIYKQIGDELRAQYRLGFTPSAEAASTGYHPIQLSLTTETGKKLQIQTRDGYYTGQPKTR